MRSIEGPIDDLATHLHGNGRALERRNTVRLPDATLLRPDHPEGESKADFLGRFGFGPERWAVLEAALLRHAREGEVVHEERTPYGTKYEVEGTLRSPDGRHPRVLTVWLVEADEERPRFVTLNPSRRWRSR